MDQHACCSSRKHDLKANVTAFFACVRCTETSKPSVPTRERIGVGYEVEAVKGGGSRGARRAVK